MQTSTADTARTGDDTARLRERIATLEQALAASNEQRRSREALSFLAEASSVLASSLDYEETLAHLARVAVPHIADWCAIDLRARDGTIERLAVAHIDPAKVALAEEIWRRWPVSPDAPTGVPNVIRTGKPEVTSVITTEMVIEGIADPELRAIFLSIGLSSLMIVPLTTRERTLGALTLAAAESGRHFTEDDLRLAEDIAHRAAIAIDNAELYRELRQFRGTLDRTLDCVFMFDAETLRFFYVNQGAMDQVGYSADELMVMTPLDIKPAFSLASFQAMIAPLVSGAVPVYNFETLHRHKDGHDVPVEIALQYVDPPEGNPRFVAIVRDITERKRVQNELQERERRFRELADAMPLVVWTADPGGKVTYFNRRWYEFSGLTPEASLGDGWGVVIHPDDLSRTVECWNDARRTETQYEVEYRWRNGEDGGYSWWLGRALPVRNSTGAISYWVGTGTYIDEQKRAEDQLREQTESLALLTRQLEDRNRELDQFAYITSHDLKAPLRGMANLAQWIEEDLGDTVTDEIRQQFELLRGRAHRMEALIDGILQYSRVGRMAEEPQTVDVNALLDDIIDLLAPPPDTVTIVGPLPTLITARVPLQQVFHNLIGNALKHGGPNVQVRIWCVEQDASYAFTVADSGPGIPSQYHERIFGIFQTLASRDRVEGSGLGLALVKKIVEVRGGRISLESAEGRGAAFTFTWPRNSSREPKRR